MSCCHDSSDCLTLQAKLRPKCPIIRQRGRRRPGARRAQKRFARCGRAVEHCVGGRDPEQSRGGTQEPRVERGSRHAPKRTRTSTRESPNKALNLVRRRVAMSHRSVDPVSIGIFRSIGGPGPRRKSRDASHSASHGSGYQLASPAEPGAELTTTRGRGHREVRSGRDRDCRTPGDRSRTGVRRCRGAHPHLCAYVRGSSRRSRRGPPRRRRRFRPCRRRCRRRARARSGRWRRGSVP